MGDLITEICGRLIAVLFYGAILLPLATPFVLLIACLQRGKYWANVRSNYGRILEFCDWTWFT